MTRRSKFLLALLAALLLHALLFLPWGSGESQLPEGAGSGLNNGEAQDNQSVMVLAPQEVSGSGIETTPTQAAPSGGGGGHGGYLARLRAHLNRYKSAPPSEVAARGVVQVRFTVASDGAASAVAVSRSSGSAELDAQAVALVLRAAPLPAPPQGRAQTLIVPVEFR